MTKQLHSSIYPHTFSVTDYNRMLETGILTAKDKVELLDGQIVVMSPIGRFHAACVNRLNRFLSRADLESVLISVQNPILLDDRSEPEPDITIVKYQEDFYASGHPGPSDILTLIEVADSSIEKDQIIKIPLYARAGIAEVWIVDLAAGNVTVYQHPMEEAYKQITTFVEEEVISTHLPIVISVTDVLG